MVRDKRMFKMEADRILMGFKEASIKCKDPSQLYNEVCYYLIAMTTLLRRYNATVRDLSKIYHKTVNLYEE